MAQILVRDLDDEVVERLKSRAKEEGRSLQSVVKLVLEQAAREPKVDMERARKISEQFRRKFRGRKFPDTVKSIREGRAR
jgi:plasmid stability protein